MTKKNILLHVLPKEDKNFCGLFVIIIIWSLDWIGTKWEYKKGDFKHLLNLLTLIKFFNHQFKKLCLNLSKFNIILVTNFIFDYKIPERARSDFTQFHSQQTNFNSLSTVFCSLAWVNFNQKLLSKINISKLS